ncbi:MAG TPA: nucleotide exchange factor GrpE [Roseiflexaceae bacterium]|nr:nucleotide exchange factor GrpE [Roseiflexaceae bacterium]
MSFFDRGGRRGAGGMSLGECQAALSAVQQQVAELNDKYLRVAAALDNTRKQAERDATQRVSARARAFAARLIEVSDNLERALAYAPADNPLRPGVQATLQQLQTALRQEGVEPIAVEPGAPFDPHFHEALAGEVADVAFDTVREVTQTGYLFEGQVLRPARVIVAHPPR